MDLDKCTRDEFSAIMAEAALLGAHDEGACKAHRTALGVLEALGVSRYRNGHSRALKAAYSGGRFHERCRGK